MSNRKNKLLSIKNKKSIDERLKQVQTMINDSGVKNVKLEIIPLNFTIVSSLDGKTIDWCDLMKIIQESKNEKV